MKSIITLTLLLCSLALVSCNNKKQEASEIDESENKIRLSLVTQEAPRSPSHRGFIAFARKLNELSGDTMVVDINQLTATGTLDDIFTSVTAGIIDIAAMGYADRVNLIPELEIVGKAYVVRDYEHFLKILESDYGRRMGIYFRELGMIHSSLWYLGFRHVTSNIPINSIKDFEGLNFRIQPTGSLKVFAETLLAEPIATSYNDLYDAVKSGKVDSLENTIANIEATRVYQHQKYIAMTAHLVGTLSLFINKDRYDSFTDEQKAWYNEAMEYARKMCYDLVVEQEDLLLDKFQFEYHMTVTYPNKDELRNVIKPRYDEMEEKLGYGAIYSLMEMK